MRVRTRARWKKKRDCETRHWQFNNQNIHQPFLYFLSCQGVYVCQCMLILLVPCLNFLHEYIRTNVIAVTQHTVWLGSFAPQVSYRTTLTKGTMRRVPSSASCSIWSLTDECSGRDELGEMAVRSITQNFNFRAWAHKWAMHLTITIKILPLWFPVPKGPKTMTIINPKSTKVKLWYRLKREWRFQWYSYGHTVSEL